jgi:ADP-ribose pyrophosphatase YjhB (NUDIX family)
MTPVRKAYAYITRQSDSTTELLVFRHANEPEAGVQVPRGTVDPGEEPAATVIREVHEETGLRDVALVGCLAVDLEEQPGGTLYQRHFFHLATTSATLDTWTHTVTGHGDDNGMLFVYSWVRSAAEAGLWLGFGDYLPLIFGIS